MKYAIISHNIDFVTYLLYEHNIKINLMWCCIYNNLQAFLVYLDQTNDLNMCFIYSPLFNRISICKYLIKHGADINSDYIGSTALYYAVKTNSKNIVEFLIANHAKIDIIDFDGYTPLMHAIIKNNIEIVKLHILHGANIYRHNSRGNDCFQVAKYHQRTEIICLLHILDSEFKNKQKAKQEYENNKKMLIILVITFLSILFLYLIR
ncbi:ankyrin repeat protein, putative [Trichomonas vaginalis G3]|uniref:Ankyrin repeat protein, putative n=1 Tax=Trichomonas vaginalis (strain ATCC PRA-98 / G3) TaxID=412133 RepID=A2DAR8_TRIV3|nr:spectrin binding [Trichomonas vaginalis G3]EAY22571.1 ankyrin repeat protein, putative [Trichomonas vaginalis G3]KAI5497303.1 spectrin binding [Trichomonas vaginalis G3]|eukprot:XP_001583557.1 ankyrin repeat protein [Trichomonas vaginalis G3]